MIRLNGRLTRLGVAVCAIAVFAVASHAQTSVIAKFLPEPSTPLLSELIWAGGVLSEGPGAIGTGFGVPGDGSITDPPGLTVESQFIIAGIPGSEVNGSTTFFDATLDLANWASGGAAVVTAIANGISAVLQPLDDGSFDLWSSDPVGADSETLLLSGRIENAAIAGILGSPSGAVLSGTVAYTGGVILDAAIAAGLDASPGSLSFSLVATPPLAIDAATGILRDFGAQSTGEFATIPEPASLLLLGLGSLLALRRRH